MLKQLKPLNALTFQNNEKYLNLNSKIDRNIQRKQRRKEWISLSYSRKKDHVLITISEKLYEEGRETKSQP